MPTIWLQMKSKLWVHRIRYPSFSLDKTISPNGRTTLGYRRSLREWTVGMKLRSGTRSLKLLTLCRISSWNAVGSLICPPEDDWPGDLSYPYNQFGTLNEIAFLVPSPSSHPEKSDFESRTQLLERPPSSREGKEAEDSTAHDQKKRKRGRPKLNSSNRGSSGLGRTPHSTVERKYRENLNASMYRLRDHLPTLPQQGGEFVAPPRLSKATILAAAVDYIKYLETKNKCLEAENEEFRKVQSNVGIWTLGRRETERNKRARIL